MYRCQKCNQVVAAGIKVRKVVVESRPTTYLQMKSVGKADSKRKEAAQTPVRSDGWETVKQIRVCQPCEEILRKGFEGVAAADRRGESAKST